ncbi:hypothetical protein B296_00007752 [Ensete ventricosum]|uniref:Uncharacterized protein n=1 Tax=Ensete ventricosum TaxID=4639 RepID=A0A427AKK9_ENSVE|nr:hypothetical protein B296_00007752 [Ensete ventricosum]
MFNGSRDIISSSQRHVFYRSLISLPLSRRSLGIFPQKMRVLPPPAATSENEGFASSRSCGRCGYALNLSSSNLNTAGIGAEYRRAIRKGVVSFLAIDETRFTQADELRCLPYFRSHRSWGLLRRRTRLLCGGCGCLIGVAYRGDAVSSDDNSPPPPASGSTISGSARCSPPTTTSQLRPFSRDQSIWFSD